MLLLNAQIQCDKCDRKADVQVRLSPTEHPSYWEIVKIPRGWDVDGGYYAYCPTHKSSELESEVEDAIDELDGN